MYLFFSLRVFHLIDDDSNLMILAITNAIIICPNFVLLILLIMFVTFKKKFYHNNYKVYKVFILNLIVPFFLIKFLIETLILVAQNGRPKF